MSFNQWVRPVFIGLFAVLLAQSSWAAVSTSFQIDSGFWNDSSNWTGGLPGHLQDGSETEINDLAIVSDGRAVYIQEDDSSALGAYDVWIGTSAAGGSVSVSANLLGMNDVLLGTNGMWSQSAGEMNAASLSVGDTASFYLTGGSFATSADAVVDASGTLSLKAASFVVGGDLDLNGSLSLVLAERGFDAVQVAGTLSIDSSDATLSIDANGYQGGARTIELIQFGSVSGQIDPTRIHVMRLPPKTTATIVYDDDSMNLLLETEPESASTFWISHKPLAGTEFETADDLICNNGRALLDLDVPGMTCVHAPTDEEIIYSVTWTGTDFDGDAVNDTLTYELHVEGFAGSIYFYTNAAAGSSMTALGAATNVTSTSGLWSVGIDEDIDAGETLQFSIENLQVSVAGYVAELVGFSGMVVAETSGGRDHTMVLGEGTGLESHEFDGATSTITFDPVEHWVVTGAGSFYAGTKEWSVTDIQYQLNVYEPFAVEEEDLTDYSKFVTGPGYGDTYSKQASDANYPEFSWDTIPRWLIIRKSSAYTDDEISSMATNYNLIVWEKANKAGFDSIEEGILDASTRVRAVDPTTKNIFYFNSYIHYTGYLADAEYAENAWEWSEHTIDDDGAACYDLFKDRYYSHNYAVQGMRDWWVDTLVGMATHEAIDGVFIDKVTQQTRTLYDDQGAPNTDYSMMVNALSDGLPDGKLFLGNTLRNERDGGGRAYMELQEGSYFERWMVVDSSTTPAQSVADATAVSIQLMREALSRGKIVMIRASGSIDSQEELEADADFNVAAFLIGAETNAYLAHQGSVDATQDQWKWDASWMDVFQRPLGSPLGAPVQDGYIYTRSFEHVDVLVNLSTLETVLAWDSADTDGDGIDDLWEYQNFGGITNAIASGNEDGDAYTNLEEYIAGLSPWEVDDSFLSHHHDGSESTLEWTAVSGRCYNVYWTSNLLMGFTLIESNAIGGSYSDTNHVDDPVGFYQIQIQFAE